MRLTTDTIIKILLVLLVVCIIIYYDKIFPSFNVNNVKTNIEGFITIEQGKLNENNTVYENAVYNTFSKYPNMICNILPHITCRKKHRFPVHIIKAINGKYIAVFNDGKLYTTDDIKQNTWIGPIENSMPNRGTHLRMITTNPEGNNLIGIGYDNKAYIKRGEKILDLKADWSPLNLNTDCIYLIYKFDKEGGRARKVIIDTNGYLRIESDTEGEFGDAITTPGHRLIKVFQDLNGYMLGIDTNFRLGTFDDKNWTSSRFNNKFQSNYEHFINDIIYDNDTNIIGLTFNVKDSILDIEKQRYKNKDIDYQNKFYPLDKSETVSNNTTDNSIIVSKIGMSELLGKYSAAEEDGISAYDNDVYYAQQRQIMNDNLRLREYCKQRNSQVSGNFIDLELNRYLDSNGSKLDKINHELNKLITS